MGSGQLDVEVIIAHRRAHLIPGPSGQKHAVGGGEGNDTTQSQTGGGAYHVLLGNAHVQEVLRVLIPHPDRAGGFGHIGIQRHHRFSVSNEL